LSHAHAQARRLILLALAVALAFALSMPALAGAGGKGRHGHYRAHVHDHHQGHHGKRHGHHGKRHGRHRHHGHRGHHGHGKGKRDLSVLTQNLYLGSSLTPALAAETADEFVAAVALIYGTVQFTDFPARAEAIADKIEEKKPDLIGLQEVSKWTTEGLNPPDGYEFLEILEDALAARGLHYSVAAIAHNANIGPAPLVSETCPTLPVDPFFTCQVTLEDRDVILINDDTHGLSWSNPQSGQYSAQQSFEPPGGEPVSFDRGWASIDAKLKGLPFRFVNTHLETEESPLVQEAQAAEFLAGPASGGTVVATGDFNSAADGTTTGSYALLTAPGKFRDAWDEGLLGPGLTCCQSSTLTNSVTALTTRIDLILSRGAARSDGDEAELVGDATFQAEPPLWPSDHAGVFGVLRLSH
jgi:endonuclease/exonuclease/phosphatase family metal-dependent hydrolase